MDFEEVQALIDGLDEAEVLGEFEEQRDAAEGAAVNAVVEIEMEIATTAEDGLGGIGALGLVETAADEAFAGVELGAEAAVAFAGGGLAVQAALSLASGGFVV
jgi:hypothetical protein